MKVSAEQIEQLFNFTKKHLVEHYDVQVELVDHLANAIEEQWIENPNISFEDALQIEFKKFGVFGFTGLVEQKQAVLKDYYWKIMKRALIRFFSIPKIIFSGILFWMLFLFFSNPSPWLVANDYIILLSVLVVTTVVFSIKKQNLKPLKNGCCKTFQIIFMVCRLCLWYTLDLDLSQQR